MYIYRKVASSNASRFVTHLVYNHTKNGNQIFYCLLTYLVECTGCLNMLCQTSNHLLGIKNTLLSHKNGICTFMRCGNLTYDTWIWLKITFLSSTASVLNDGRISLEISSFCSEIFFFSKHQNRVILAIGLLISRI